MIRYIIVFLLLFPQILFAKPLVILETESIPPYVFNSSHEGFNSQILKESFSAVNIAIDLVRVPYIAGP